MQLARLTKTHWMFVIFTALFLVTRLPDLGTDVINPDAVNWHFRSEQFVRGLKGDWLRTYQHYHPGVTLMWIIGPTVEIIRQLFPFERVYSEVNFLMFHTWSKIILVLAQLVLSIILVLLFSDIFGKVKAFYIVSLFTLEPFFVGNSRLLHLDVLLTLFLLIGLTLSYLTIQNFNKWKVILAGSFLALAFLTKSVAIGGLIFVIFVGGAMALKRSGLRISLKYIGLILVGFLVTLFAVFPALWGNAYEVLYSIFDEAERVGVRKGHGQIFFGKSSRDPGIFYYPVSLILKISPLSIIGLLFYKFSNFRTGISRFISQIKDKNLSLPIYLLLFFIGYLAIMVYSAKKIDRYLLPLYPLISIFAVLGIYNARDRLRKYFGLVVAVLVLVFLVLPLYSTHPYQLTYTSPVFGSAKNAHQIIAQKPFGVGIPALKDYIFENYGEYPTLGFIDTKPMRMIYKNSKIFDIREYGTSKYDILILGPNEEIPEKVLKSDSKFVLDNIFYINGLEYWKIYVKEGWSGNSL